MRNRWLLLLKYYLLTVLIFIIAKVAFMLYNHDAVQELTLTDIWQVLYHGLTLDLSTALYFLIVPFLTAIASIWMAVPRWLLRGYWAIAAVTMALAFVADTCLYPFWGFKLDATCLSYLETPTEAAASVSTTYLLLRGLMVVLVAVGIYATYGVTQTYESIPARPKDACYRRDASPPKTTKLLETVLFLLCTPLIVIGIRGGLSESTTNIGQVYFSQTQFFNHSAVNPVFSFLSSFEKTANVNITYSFMPADEAEQTVAPLFNTDTIEPNTLLTTQRPDVVIILLESCGAMFDQVMPNLRRLKQEGISFDSCYGNSYRTDRGTVCTLSGFPAYPTMSVMKMPSKTRVLPAIAKSLQREGYHTSYIYGGDINFTNMRGYLVSTGFEQLTSMDDYTVEQQHSAKWGVRDDITFETLYERITSFPLDSSFNRSLVCFSSLSTHEPWDVPIQKYADEKLNAFHYLDQCIGRLISRLKSTPQWDNLLVILLPDHSITYKEYTEQHPARNLIPMVWCGGAVRSHRRIKTICNQSDLAATLLGQMGIDHSDFLYSRDVMSRSYTYPFAIHFYNNGFSMVDSTGFVNYDLDASQLTVPGGFAAGSPSPLKEKNAMKGKAILQVTADYLQNLEKP